MPKAIKARLLADKFQVGALIRRGQSGDLYRGWHVLLDRPVILKILPPEISKNKAVVARFFDQARVEAKLSHPNILNLTDFGSDIDGLPYAVYEGGDFETLKSLVERAGKLPVSTVVETGREILSALSAAHSAELIHGSITTETVLVPERDGSAKVFDFGRSTITADAETSKSSESAYAAPEQSADPAFSDARSDIYSVGLILYEMLAGELPAKGRTADIEEPPAPVSAFRQDLPPGLEAAILKALAHDPAMRYESAAKFAEALETATLEVPDASKAAAAAPASNIWKSAFIVLAGISLLSAFLIYAASSRRTDPATVLQPDANAQPVQPINPATGVEEQNLALMPGMLPDAGTNSNASQSGILPGGDGYDPWARGGAPPTGAPSYIPPAGQNVTVDPNAKSPFMPDAGCIMQPSGILLCPVPVTPNANMAKPTPTPRRPAVNTNMATGPPANVSENRGTPTPAPKSAASPQQKPSPAGAKPEIKDKPDKSN